MTSFHEFNFHSGDTLTTKIIRQSTILHTYQCTEAAVSKRIEALTFPCNSSYAPAGCWNLELRQRIRCQVTLFVMQMSGREYEGEPQTDFSAFFRGFILQAGLAKVPPGGTLRHEANTNYVS